MGLTRHFLISVIAGTVPAHHQSHDSQHLMRLRGLHRQRIGPGPFDPVLCVKWSGANAENPPGAGDSSNFRSASPFLAAASIASRPALDHAKARNHRPRSKARLRLGYGVSQRCVRINVSKPRASPAALAGSLQGTTPPSANEFHPDCQHFVDRFLLESRRHKTHRFEIISGTITA